MKPYLRISLIAVLLLLAFFSLPFWLPTALAAFSTPPAAAEAPASEELNQAQIPAAVQPYAVQALESSPLLAGASPLLLWSNNWSEVNGVENNDPKLVAWAPGSGDVLWSLDTGFAYGALADPAGGRVYFLEEPLHEAFSAGEPLQLGVVDLATGELLSRTALTERFFANSNSGAPRPILLLSEQLYFTNYGSLNNLAIYDLSSGTLGEERYDLCETGYPIQWAYDSEMQSLVTLCVDFSTDMAGSLTRLSLVDGSSASLDLPQLGSEEYMGGNGLALGASGTAYVLDSDAYQILEIDLATMQIARQASYAAAETADSSLWQRAIAWLLEQAASPAAAKRMFAVTAVSPDGSRLAVGGSWMSAEAHNIYMIDLASLQNVQQMRIGDTPNQLTFTSDHVLLALYESTTTTKLARGVAIDLTTNEQDVIELPFVGYLSQLIQVK
jgi:hypothetical protein